MNKVGSTYVRCRLETDSQYVGSLALKVVLIRCIAPIIYFFKTQGCI